MKASTSTSSGSAACCERLFLAGGWLAGCPALRIRFPQVHQWLPRPRPSAPQHQPGGQPGGPARRLWHSDGAAAPPARRRGRHGAGGGPARPACCLLHSAGHACEPSLQLATCSSACCASLLLWRGGTIPSLLQVVDASITESIFNMLEGCLSGGVCLLAASAVCFCCSLAGQRLSSCDQQSVGKCPPQQPHLDSPPPAAASPLVSLLAFRAEYAAAGAVRPPSGSTLTGVVPSGTFKAKDGVYVGECWGFHSCRSSSPNLLP